MSEDLPSNKIDLSNVVNHNSNFDISYIEYNRNNIPFKINATYISQNNDNINNGKFKSFFGNGTLNNNLIIESSNNDIILATSENNKVKVTNNIEISNNLHVTNTIKANDICLNNILYVNSNITKNIIGDLKIDGRLSLIGGGKITAGSSEFTDATLSTSKITLSDISDSSLNNVEISGSIIYNTAIGRNNDGSINAKEAAFSNIDLIAINLNKNLGSSETDTSIIFTDGGSNKITIKDDNDYQKLKIDKHLNVGSNDTIGTSIFNGDISCNTLHYINLDPDICFNNYTDVSFGHFTLSGNIIPSKDLYFNIGSKSNKFNNIYSQLFIGDLSGNASTCSLANDLSKNLDMCFNNLTINGLTNSNSIIPNVNINSDLGANDKKWKNAYIQDLSVNNNLDVSGNLKCNIIQIGNTSIGENDFNQGLDISSLNAFTFTDISLTGKLLLDNSKNNYVFFQDISKTLHDNSGGIEIATMTIDSTNDNRTFNVEQNYYYKVELYKDDISSIIEGVITFTYTYKDGTVKSFILNTNTINVTLNKISDPILQNTNYFSNHSFFNDRKRPVLFLFHRNIDFNRLIIAAQNSNLASINISSTNNSFNIKLFKLYSKPKGLFTKPNSSLIIYTISYFYYNGSNANTINSITMNDLYYVNNISDNSNNIRIGTGLLNNASNQILIGNYNETFDRSGNNVILGNSYCESWLPPHGYTTDLGSTNYPFKNCYISENLNISGDINGKKILGTNDKLELYTNTNSSNSYGFIELRSSKCTFGGPNLEFYVNSTNTSFGDCIIYAESNGVAINKGANAPTHTLEVNGDIKGDNLFLGDNNTTPKIDMYFNESQTNPGINQWSTKIEIGKSNDFTSSPAYPPLNSMGMNIQNNSDGLFVGIETYDNGSNWRPLLKWGDDSTDTPFAIQSHSGGHRWEFGTDGRLMVPNSITSNKSNNLYINSASNKDINFTVNDDNKMIIKSDGKVGIGTTTPSNKLDVNGDIKGDNLFLGDNNTTPKINMTFIKVPDGIYDTRIEIGKSDDFISVPAQPPSNAFGMNVQANSDGLFLGIETYDNGNNYRPLLKWGDDSSDTPFAIQSHSGDHKWEFGTDGRLVVPNVVKGAPGTICKIHILPFTDAETANISSNNFTDVVGKTFTKTAGTNLFGEVSISYLIAGFGTDRFESRLNFFNNPGKTGSAYFIDYNQNAGGGQRSGDINGTAVYTDGTGTGNSGSQGIYLQARRAGANDTLYFFQGFFKVTEIWA